MSKPVTQLDFQIVGMSDQRHLNNVYSRISSAIKEVLADEFSTSQTMVFFRSHQHSLDNFEADDWRLIARQVFAPPKVVVRQKK